MAATTGQDTDVDPRDDDAHHASQRDVDRIEQALRDGDPVFRHLADALPQIVWITRPDGYHEFYNRHWWEYTGLTREQAMGEGWNLLLHPDDRQRAIDRWDRALRTGEPYEVEYRFRRASDGVYRWFLGRALPLRDAGGRIVRWFGTCTDIDDQKRAKAELKRAKELAEAASRAKDDFLATVSHELRTPLNAILGYVQLIRMGVLTDAEWADAVEKIENNAKAQAQLVEDLLDVSRIISGSLRIERRAIDVGPVVRAAVGAVEPVATEAGVSVEYQAAADGHLAWGDPGRLQQAVWNLLSNAVKFSSRGGRVLVRVDRAASGLRVTVSDQGRGIESDFLPHVFERFRQADGSSTRRYGGLGLGLAIVRHIAEAHGGSVEARSDGPGRGSTFTLVLPAPAARPDERPPDERPGEHATERPGKRPAGPPDERPGERSAAADAAARRT